MRWKIVIPVILIVVLILSPFIFLDKILKTGVIKAGQAAIQARVEVADVKVKYFPFSVSFYGIKVANPKEPMKNIFELGSVTAAMRFLPLLQKKVVIDEMSVKNVSFDTDRSRSGALVKEEIGEIPLSSPLEKGETGFVQKLGAKAKDKGRKVAAVDSQKVVDKATKVSKQKAEDAKKDFQKVQKKWEGLSQDKAIENEVSEISSEYKKLEKFDGKKFETIEDIKSINDFISSVNTIREKADTVAKDVEKKKKAFNEDNKYLNGLVSQVSKAGYDDYNKALKRLKLDQLSGGNFTQTYFSDPIRKKIEPYMAMMKKGLAYKEKYLPKSKAIKPEKKERYRGIDIHFPKKNAYPKFWLKRVVISGKGKGNEYVSGIIQNISSDQNVIGKAMTGRINIKDALYQGTVCDMNFVHNKKESADTKIIGKMSGFKVMPMTVLDQGSKKINLDSGIVKIDMNLRVIGEEIKGKAVGVGRRLKFKAKGINSRKLTMESVTAKVLQDISTIKVKARVSGTLDDLDISLSSDLDKQVARKMNKLKNKELDAMKKKLKKQFDQQIAEQKRELNNLVAAEKSKLSSGIKQYENQVDTLKSSLDNEKKKAEAKIQAIKDQVQEEAARKIKAAEEKARQEADKAKEVAKKKAEEEAKKQLDKTLQGLF